MRPRNILTETNDMRKLMGLPLINEGGEHTVEDIKKQVLNENAPAFSLGFARGGGLTIAEEDLEPMEDNVMQEEDIDETTEAEDFRDEGDDDLDVVEEDDEIPMNEIEKAQKMAEARALKEKESKSKSVEDNLTEDEKPEIQYADEKWVVVDLDPEDEDKEDWITEDTGFAKYNITLHD